MSYEALINEVGERYLFDAEFRARVEQAVTTTIYLHKLDFHDDPEKREWMVLAAGIGIVLAEKKMFNKEDL